MQWGSFSRLINIIWWQSFDEEKWLVIWREPKQGSDIRCHISNGGCWAYLATKSLRSVSHRLRWRKRCSLSLTWNGKKAPETTLILKLYHWKNSDGKWLACNFYKNTNCVFLQIQYVSKCMTVAKQNHSHKSYILLVLGALNVYGAGRRLWT